MRSRDVRRLEKPDKGSYYIGKGLYRSVYIDDRSRSRVIVQGFRVQQLGGWHVMRNRVGDHPVASTNNPGFQ